MSYVKEMEDAHNLFNLGDFISREIKHKNYSIVFNDELPDDLYLNYVTYADKIDESFIENIENIFKKHKSIPNFYVDSKIEKFLIKNGYKVFATDVWMISTKQIKSKLNAQKLPKTKIIEFKNVYNEVFTKGEKDDPYKGMSHMLGEFVNRRLTTTKRKSKTEPYVVLMDRKIVGIVNLIYNKKYACIYSLAVLPKYRNSGICKALLSACVKRAQELKVKLFLQTAKDSRNEDIFKKLGFKTIFVKSYLYRK